MVDEVAIQDGTDGPPRSAGAVPEGLDRLDALERQVRQLMSRLAGWVESQLVQAVEDRRGDLRSLRTELQSTLDEQVAAIRAEATSVLTVAVRRLSVNQEELGDRLDGLSIQTSRSADVVTALSVSVGEETARVLAFEEQVRAAVARVSKTVELRMGEMEPFGSEPFRAGLRAELCELFDERILPVAAQAAQAIEGVATVSSSLEDRTARLEAFEERARAAVNRLTESVGTRLGELEAVRRAELDTIRSEFRAEIEASRNTTILAFRVELGEVVDGHLQEIAAQAERATQGLAAMSGSHDADAMRMEAFEERARTAMAQHGESVNSRLVESARAERAELDGLRESVAGLTDSLEAEARRSDALEDRFRVVAGRLTESVEALASKAASRPVELEAVQAELQEVLTRQLAEARAQVAAAVAGSNKRSLRSQEQLGTRLDDVARRLESRIAELSEQGAAAAAGLDSLSSSLAVNRDAPPPDPDALAGIENRLRREQERQARAVETRVAAAVKGRATEMISLAAELTRIRSEVAAAAASQSEKSLREVGALRKSLENITGRLDGLAGALAAAAQAETGALAPLRSDVRMLQTQVSALSEVVDELRKRRRSTTPREPSPPAQSVRAVARKRAAAPVPKRPSRRTAGGEAKAGRAERGQTETDR